MAAFTAWLPARPNQDFDLVVKIVGNGSSGLIDEFTTIGQCFTDQGLEIMAEDGRLSGEAGAPTLRLRIASRPFHSIGDGLDILVYLGDEIPDFRQFRLQRGSVAVWEPSAHQRLQPVMLDGVVVYAVPLTKLAAESGEGIAKRGFVALGVLLQLLGFTEDALSPYLASVSGPRSLKAGFQFAQRSLAKRDVYSLPVPNRGQCRIMLNAHQAVMLGFAVSHCACGTECDERLNRSPTDWMTRHATVADGMVSLLHSEMHPGVQAYRGPHGNVFALMRGNDSAARSCINGHASPRMLVAADVPDVLQLLVEGHHMIRLMEAGAVAVVIEERLAARQQSVAVDRLAKIVRGREQSSEYDGTRGAEVGYVAWGMAQGMVRDAVALCRSFGLNVAAFYPRRVLPFPAHELEAFARTVTRVVIVESGQTGGLAERVRASCSFEAGVIRPEAGRSLTPMDIFQREGLGAS
jgi:hypothetical protein